MKTTLSNKSVNYFSATIKSLADLKKEYRQLALTNHPDKGGSTSTMQIINAEFDKLYAIWQNRPDTNINQSEPETAKQYRRNFYTEYGWKGSRYDRNLSTKEIAACVRSFVKEHWSQYKFSICIELFAGGSSITLKLVSGPVPAFIAGSEYARRGYLSTTSHIRKYEGITEAVLNVVNNVCDYLNSFNYDDSDSMIDYFDTNFYTHIGIGELGKPYEVKKSNPSKNQTDKKEKTTDIDKEEVKVSTTTSKLELVDYSEKAIAVFGDTKAVKEQLYDLGGRFNHSLNHNGEKEAGWIFSKKLTEKVKTFISQSNRLEIR